MAKNLRFDAFGGHYCCHIKWGLRINRLSIWRSQPPYFRHSDGAHSTNLRNCHNTLLLFDESENAATTAAARRKKQRERQRAETGNRSDRQTCCVHDPSQESSSKRACCRQTRQLAITTGQGGRAKVPPDESAFLDTATVPFLNSDELATLERLELFSLPKQRYHKLAAKLAGNVKFCTRGGNQIGVPIVASGPPGAAVFIDS